MKRLTVRLDTDEVAIVEEIAAYYKDTYSIKLTNSDVLRLALKRLNQELGGENSC